MIILERAACAIEGCPSLADELMLLLPSLHYERSHAASAGRKLLSHGQQMAP